MEGFTAGAFLIIGALWGIFCFGAYSDRYDVAKDCNKNGEVIIRNVVFQCKPVATIIEGKRIVFKETVFP